MDDRQIRTGSRVMWRGAFGSAPAREAVVTAIEVATVRRSKYGTPAQSVPWVRKDCACFTLGNGHWCYGDQIVSLL